MNNFWEEILKFKEIFAPKLKKLLEWKYSPEMQEAIAYGEWYKLKITKQVVTEKEEEMEIFEDWKIVKKVVPTSVIDYIDVDNDEDKLDFIVNKYLDILADRTVSAITKYYSEVVASAQMSEALKWLYK